MELEYYHKVSDLGQHTAPLAFETPNALHNPKFVFGALIHPTLRCTDNPVPLGMEEFGLSAFICKARRVAMANKLIARHCARMNRSIEYREMVLDAIDNGTAKLAKPGKPRGRPPTKKCQTERTPGAAKCSTDDQGTDVHDDTLFGLHMENPPAYADSLKRKAADNHPHSRAPPGFPPHQGHIVDSADTFLAPPDQTTLDSNLSPRTSVEDPPTGQDSRKRKAADNHPHTRPPPGFPPHKGHIVDNEDPVRRPLDQHTLGSSVSPGVSLLPSTTSPPCSIVQTARATRSTIALAATNPRARKIRIRKKFK